MVRYIARRIALGVLTLWVIATLTFVLMHAIPGDPFASEKLTPQIHQLMLVKYGMDRPLIQQYFTYLGNLVRGDLGYSMRQMNRTVNDMIREGFPVSAHLGLQAIAVGVTFGLVLGVIAAVNHNRWPDYVVILLALLFVSIPGFVVGALMQYVFGVRLGWLPVARWEGFVYTIMPTLALGLSMMAGQARFMRSSMLEVLDQDYVRTAESKGLSRREVLWRHTIRNAILPIVTIMGPLVAGVVTGSFIIESMFGIPGLGKYYVQSIYNRDYPLIMGTTMFYAVLLVAMMLLVDLAYTLVDPRIRLGKASD
ncbi:MAG: ABC transporter permease [Limnochordaceae bacterium]|uniref:ABC transporter permease n=1 Tax=Carboxydichorda subterranea TaxID=3109565 RepID=A0ABZ1BUV1_9FIRM|nr:ABC transporter permease [Limnochorda sp. L945t]MBE3597345.1 ABC transporter permease [Limnochordaceae bacterium]WRP16395.1 ABC transporter permease [Limnochorda sp. L945t]